MSREGKSIGPGSVVQCEVCEENPPSSFCGDCNQSLCRLCEKYHRKIASTRSHTLIPVGERNYSTLELAHDADTGIVSLMGVSLCKMFDSNKVIAFEKMGEEIRVFDLDACVIDKYSYDGNIVDMIAVTPDRYAVLELERKDVNMYNVDESFSKLYRTFYRGNWEPSGICRAEENKYIVIETHVENRSMLLWKVEYTGDRMDDASKMLQVNLRDWLGIMAYHGTGCVTMAIDDGKTVCTIDLRIKKYEKLEIGEVVTSICADGDVVLIGTKAGNVHKMRDGELQGVILSGLGPVTGLVATDSAIVLTSGNRLLVYK